MTKRSQFLRSAHVFDGPKPKAVRPPRASRAKTWVGVDGEGVTIGEPRPYNTSYTMVLTGSAHNYISMSWRDASGEGEEIIQEKLSTIDCLEFILSIPEKHKIAAYGFGYDLTKMLDDLPPFELFKLTHPDERSYRDKRGFPQRHPVEWKGYVLDLFNSRFRVGRAVESRVSPKGTQHYTGRDWRTVHDLSKFYQCPFVTACKKWDVGTPEERTIMREMKKDRRNLARYTQNQILDYSNKECEWLAQLAQKLDDACEVIGIELGTAYFGAGSIAKGLLKKWGIQEKLPKNLPDAIAIAGAHAYFGGRFEISRRGKITTPVHDWDISSAYPYQIYRLPCLTCGTWSLVKDLDRVRGSQAALVRYSLAPWKGPRPPWGPFPFRCKDGSIPFPLESAGGWMHKDEFLQGQRMWPNVVFHEAWVYETNCKHRPFEQIPEVYLERMRIGKEGPGIVLKLGTNAVAGNIMQMAGGQPGPFFQVIWAGMITSGTRAQNLELIECHEKWSDVLMIATDGLWSLSKCEAPKPIDTGTDIEVTETKSGKKNRKPLGGWEHGLFEKGVFMARPGVYFPLDLPDELDESEQSEAKTENVKARGLGVRVLYKHRAEIIDCYEKHHGAHDYLVKDDDALRVIRERDEPFSCERFIGLRGGIVTKYKRDGERIYGRRSALGLWTLQMRKVGFDPLPKRTLGNGPLFGEVDTLHVRSMPPNQESAIYAKMALAIPSEREKHGLKLKEMKAEQDMNFDDDQSDWSYE